MRPEDIDMIVLTHLHWDHCYNLEKFPNAEIYVQKSEIKYALDPLPCHRYSYEIRLELTPPWIVHQEKFVVMDGDYTLIEGVDIYHLPGTIFCNLADYYESLDRMETLADYVLPGHDIKLTKFNPIL